MPPEGQAPPAAVPEIHVTTRLVQIGVIVRDKNGRPVPGLTAGDFAVHDRGQAQEVKFFSAESAGPPGPAAAALPPGTYSDLPQYGASVPNSVTIVLLDNLNTLYSSGAVDQFEEIPFWTEDLALAKGKAQLIEFVSQLDPRDRIAIYGLTDSLKVLCDFTSDREQLLAILKKYDTGSRTNRGVVAPGMAHAPVLEQEADPFENAERAELAGMANGRRAMETMAALEAIAAHVANVPGRKNLVWLTANLPFSGAAMARVLGPANIAVYPVDVRGLLARALPGARTSIEAEENLYSSPFGRIEHAPAQSEQPMGIDAMQKLADETGGQAFVNTNDLTGAIRKAVDDSAVSYTLGFYIDSAAADGTFHELKVTAKPAGLRLRYPKGYFAFKDSPSTTDELRTSWRAAVRSPIEASAIPVVARIERLGTPQPDTLNILGTIDARELHLEENGDLHEGAVDVSILEQDAAGNIVVQSVHRLHLRMTAEQYAAALATGVRFQKHVEPKAGAATLRILVQDPGTALVGSLIIPLSQVP
ncbi:MAG TPA: VWA domain-containing protein [Candidatus Binatia bacterium]|nr:VWA domain-containing protein [Candidatus Binatia bacterium]